MAQHMAADIGAIVFALSIWWFGTGLIFAATRLSERGRLCVFAIGTAAAVGAVCLAAWSAGTPTIAGAYAGFGAAALLWAWHEMSFLFGYITGPRHTPCPPGARGWRRFVYAAQTLIHHELAVLATLIALLALSIGSANPTAAAAFGLLWLMRLSAKLNLYVGVSHFSDHIMPAGLAHLKSYFGPPVGHALLPASALGAAVLAIGAAMFALSGDAAPFQKTAALMLAAMAGLAALEHALLAAPVNDAALWRVFGPQRPAPAIRIDANASCLPQPHKHPQHKIRTPRGDRGHGGDHEL